MYKNYDCNIDDANKQLDKYGVAVIPNILDEMEIKDLQDGMWNMLSYLTQNLDVPIDKNNKSTWNQIQQLSPVNGMLLQHYGIGHHQSIWNVRQNPKIVNVFSKIWNEKPENMLTSIDGCSIFLPSNSLIDKTPWFHTDQSYLRNNKICVQGMVTAFDIENGDATLSVLENSHKYHKKFAETFNVKDDEDWYALSNEELSFYKNHKCREHRILAKAGSLILWDSRTIHYGALPLNKKKSNIRFVTYISQLPKKFATKSIIKKKRQIFEGLRMTTHWANKNILFRKYPCKRNKKISYIEKPVLTNLGYSLTGGNL